LDWQSLPQRPACFEQMVAHFSAKGSGDIPVSARNFALNSRRALWLSATVLLTVTTLVYINRPDSTDPDVPGDVLLTESTPPSGPAGSLVASADFASEQIERPDGQDWRKSISENLACLNSGLQTLAAVPQYTARFYKQERVQTGLTEPQLIELRLRHEPFSVHMKWLAGERGQEVLYVDGLMDGRMLVKLAGWKARILPPLKIDPNGNQALSQSRYPITEVGMASISRKLIADREADLGLSDGVTCRVFPNERCNERDCVCYIIEYQKPGLRNEYRKSVQYIDAQYNLPICVRNFAWPKSDSVEESLRGDELDDATMIELYSYSEIGWDWQVAETSPPPSLCVPGFHEVRLRRCPAAIKS